MQSLKTLAIMKTAVAISFYPELKREILCARGSEFDVTKSRFIYFRKEQWNAIIEKKAREIFRCQGLPKVLADAVLNLLPAIGLKMLIWAEYHEGTLGLTRNYSVNFLSYSHLTREGVVDNVKAAKDLLEYGNLDVKQKYKLACIYCFADNIGPLYKEIIKDHGKDAIFSASNTKWFQQPDIVKFWTLHKTRKIGKSYEYSCGPHTRLQQAIKSGCKAAVIYSWNPKGFSSQKRILLAAVEELVISGLSRSTDDDWIIFRDSRYDDVEDSWVPRDYSDDIFRFIFLKMLELEQQGGLQIDVHDFLDTQRVSVMYHHSSFKLFLCWPHQEYFMKTVTGMWEFISMKTYDALLLEISDRIEPPKYKNLQYGEEKCCDYKYILKEFWRESPDRYKRYVFQNTYWVFERNVENSTAAKDVLLKLLSLKKFTCEDEEIVRSILDSATDGERKCLLSATFWKNTFLTLMQDERFKIFDRFLRVCFRSELETDMFKQNLKLDVEEVGDICKIFLKYKKLNAIKSFLDRIPITNQIECLKSDLIYSPEGKLKCLEILSDDGTKAFEKFLGWFLPTEESAKAFKKALTLEHSCDSPHSGESRFRDKFGLKMCEELICSHSFQVVSNAGYSSLYVKSNFRGGQWEKLDRLLSSLPANRILAFKEFVYDVAGVRILYKLIEAKQWAQTEKFFKWLKLSKQEITDLKWKALTTSEGTRELFHNLVCSESDDEANKLERIYAMLKWHLTDINDVLEFRRFFLFSARGNFGEAEQHIFTSVVDMYLDELDKNHFEKLNAHVRKADRAGVRQNKDICVGGVRRQSLGPAPPKKARLSQPGVKKRQKKTVITKRRQSQRLLNKVNKK